MKLQQIREFLSCGLTLKCATYIKDFNSTSEDTKIVINYFCQSTNVFSIITCCKHEQTTLGWVGIYFTVNAYLTKTKEQEVAGVK